MLNGRVWSYLGDRSKISGLGVSGGVSSLVAEARGQPESKGLELG